MDERIKEHLKRLNRYYLLLAELKVTPLEDFQKDPHKQAVAERWLHLAIESCLNIGNRLLSIYQFEKPIKTPETYADIFRELEKLGVIKQDFAKTLIKMSKFRNRLVHLYWEIDSETTYKILNENLHDVKRFQLNIVDFLNKNSILSKIED